MRTLNIVQEQKEKKKNHSIMNWSFNLKIYNLSSLRVSVLASISSGVIR